MALGLLLLTAGAFALGRWTSPQAPSANGGGLSPEAVHALQLELQQERQKRVQADAAADHFMAQANQARRELVLSQDVSGDLPPPPEFEFPITDYSSVTPEQFRELLMVRRDELPEDLDLAVLVGNLSSQEMVEALDMLRLSPDQSRYTHQLSERLIQAWAREDPSAVLTYVDALQTWPLRSAAMDTALRELSKTEPHAAFDFLREREAQFSTQEYRRQFMKIMSGYGDTNPTEALRFAANLRPERMWAHNQRRYGFMHVFAEMRVDGTLDQAIPFVNSLPEEGNLRQDGVAALMESWGHTDPQAALAWFGEAGYGEHMDWARSNVVRRWADRNPVEAAGYVGQLPVDDPRRGNLITNVVAAWTQYDFDAPAAWLNEFPPSPQTDQAVAHFTLQTMRRDPSGAMSWAESITSDRQRQRTVERVAREWRRQDREGLTDYLRDTDAVDAATKHRILPEVFPAPAGDS
ncbi:MAG: hypothetical protein ACFB20_01315 [Opitutales bacterium]